MQQNELRLRYLRRLEGWPAAIQRYLHVLPGRPELGCCGTGDHGHWSVQANNTAAGAFAVLATDPELKPERAGMGRDEVLAWALRLVRYAMYSHHSGGGCTTDNESWGHSWISALGLERMMHGVESLEPHLTERDRQGLERLLVSECNWLMDCYFRDSSTTPGAVTAGLVARNHPENNIWNGCMLQRTARLFPDTPRRDEYLEKGHDFLLNGISIEADAVASVLIAGKPLSEWHVDANFFSSYALNHHGYLNIGYMVICLSNIAMMHFSCRANQWDAPEGLYHHARDLWQLVKTCTFPDGRLWRIGGDTRVRYSYCQDYAIPTWLLARDYFGDTDAEQFESGWLSILDTEASANPDDAFLSARLSDMESVSPLYYTRLEGDRAVTLSMGACWRRQSLATRRNDEQPASRPAPVEILTDWCDDYHGSVMVRGRNRMASWTWLAAQQAPSGQCLPPWKSCMAEWHHSLTGCIRGLGRAHKVRYQASLQQSVPGGFIICGRMTTHSMEYLAEGEANRDIAYSDQVCVALPDDRTMVVLQRARVGCRTWLQSVKGLYLPVPNDIFNGNQRTAHDAGGMFVLQGCPDTAQTHAVNGNWLNLDQCLSVVRIFGPELVVHQPAGRQIMIRGKERAGGHLHADEICCGYTEGVHAVAAGTVLFDLGAIILSGIDAQATGACYDADPPLFVASVSPDVRAVTLRGADGRRYHIVANFGDTEATEPLPASGEWSPLIEGTIIRRDTTQSARAVIPAGQAGIMVGAV